ncbi:hypothetical protein GH733_007337 [Mirounga leonina]|nr:hypothetical protein GH733_007337 [Mirounga leonina]
MKSVQFCFLFCYWRAICCKSCELTNIIITVEKGMPLLHKHQCHLNLVYQDSGSPNIQSTCTFKELMHDLVRVPSCVHHTGSLYMYPGATECHHGKCDANSTDYIM